MEIFRNQRIESVTQTENIQKTSGRPPLSGSVAARRAGVAVFICALLISALFLATYGVPSGRTPAKDGLKPPDMKSTTPAFTTPAFPHPITAAAETDPVPSGGDAADDPAIWIHPEDPSKSTIIGTDKKRGLGVYDLSGRQIQFLPDGRIVNIDIRYDFPLAGRSITLVTASNQTNDTIVIYSVNPTTRTLEKVAAHVLQTKISAYGFCMYRSPLTGKYYFFVNSKKGEVEQWELFDDGNGIVAGRMVRSFDVGSQTEGCVADDDLAHLYIGEENVGIWKYQAEPDGGIIRRLVDSTGRRGHLTSDVEGLALYYGEDGTGYLIASSQGSNAFVVYSREEGNRYLATFEIVAGNGVDAVTHTDGIDVVSSSLGTAFPKGVFVVQDQKNDGENQNYKLVSWQEIEDILD